MLKSTIMRKASLKTLLLYSILSPALIAFAGDSMHLESSKGIKLPVTRTPAPSVAPLAETPPSQNPDGSAKVCHYRVINPSDAEGHEVRTISNMILLGPSDQIWPGSIIQGKSYASGVFVPVSLPRAGGRIMIDGVVLKGDAQYYIDVDSMTANNVHNAVKKLLSQGAVSNSTQADHIFTESMPVYSREHLAYILGSDSRFLSGLNSNIYIDSTSNDSYTLLRFTQVYYNVTMDPLSTPYDAFRDKDQFQDRENQMGPDNPPLLVSNVGFGRNVYFLIASPYDSSVVKKALDSASQGLADVMTNANGKQVMLSQILSESRASYYIQGGDAIAALGNVGQISGVANLYEAIKNVIADARLAQVTDFSHGVPVRYTLNYLTDNQVAKMGFAAAFNVKTCETIAFKAPSFWIDIRHVDDNATFELQGPYDQKIKVYDNRNDVPVRIDLLNYPGLPANFRDGPITLRVTLYNAGGPAGIKFQFGRQTFGPNGFISGLEDKTGNMVRAPSPETAPFVDIGEELGWWTGNRIDYQIRFDPKTGDVQRLKRW